MLAPSNRESGAGQGSAVCDGTVVRYRVHHDVVKRALCNEAHTPQLTGCCALDSIHGVYIQCCPGYRHNGTRPHSICSVG